MRKNIYVLTAIFIFTLSTISCFSTRESDIAGNSKPAAANTETKQTQSGQAGLEKSSEMEKPEAAETPEPQKEMQDDSPDTAGNGKVENRCGWYSNPTPGNHWINDKDGEWIIGVQGGHQAEGDYPPEFSAAQWVNTNGNYGYGCVCLRVVVDRKAQRILKVLSGNAKPLSACRNDPVLTEPFE